MGRANSLMVTNSITIQAIPDQLKPAILPGKKGRMELAYDKIVVKNNVLKKRVKPFSLKLNRYLKNVSDFMNLNDIGKKYFAQK